VLFLLLVVVQVKVKEMTEGSVSYDFWFVLLLSLYKLDLRVSFDKLNFLLV
jgi:hypothetical protein